MLIPRRSYFGSIKWIVAAPLGISNRRRRTIAGRIRTTGRCASRRRMTGARFDTEPDESQFQFAKAPDAKLVRNFVVPPQPLPSELFGKPAGEFSFAGLDGNAVSRESLSGKISVLTWFTKHTACESTLRQIDKVSQRFQDNPDVAFHVVYAESSDFSDDQLRQLLESLNVEVPAVRDASAFGRDVFKIREAPTVLVLDKTSTIQVFEERANPHLNSNFQKLSNDCCKAKIWRSGL